MPRTAYRFEFRSTLPLDDVEAALVLAVLAVEALHGEAQTRLDAAWWLDPELCACVIDAATPVGEALCRIFTGFLRGEFGEDSFEVERVERPVTVDTAAPAADAAPAAG